MINKTISYLQKQ